MNLALIEPPFCLILDYREKREGYNITYFPLSTKETKGSLLEDCCET